MALVLVVDDEPDIRELVRINLEQAGHRVVTAADGDEALASVRRESPDALFLDVRMPGTDGWAVLEELQALPLEERPRVIVVSARTSLRDKAKAAELGADAFVTKPFNVDDLLVVLHDLERTA